MRGKMDEGYFLEKKELAQAGIQDAKSRLDDVNGLIASASYTLANLVNPAQIHDEITAVKIRLDNVRRDFEKARWAATDTGISFDEWLTTHGNDDLR